VKTRRLSELVAVTAAALLAPAWLCPAGEVDWLETFDTYPYPWVVTNLHAGYADWLNGDLITSLDRGVLLGWRTFPPYDPGKLTNSLKSLVLSPHGEIQKDELLELRADVLRLGGERAYAALGWQQERLGYVFLISTQEVALVKYRFDRGIFAPLFWETLVDGDRPRTMVLRFRATDAHLSLQTSLLDPLNGDQMLFDRTVLDTPVADPVAPAPAPFQGTDDPGPPWRGYGRLHLSLLGASTDFGRLEMEVDNFGTRQTMPVSVADTVAGTYTNAAGLKLPYRLFVPANQQPGTRYPLVLYLHSAGRLGSDNVMQFYEAPLEFLSPQNQARHPCFLLAPQVSAALADTEPAGWPWWLIREDIRGLMNQLQSEYAVDPDRIYVTGLSLGGTGALSLAADLHPNPFAAAVPIVGIGPTYLLEYLTDFPVWDFAGALDVTVPVVGEWTGAVASRGLVRALRRLGSNMIYTEYAAAGHDMGGAGYETPGLLDWMMAQRRGQPVGRSPWIAVKAPTTNGIWTTSYTNLHLSGTACADAGITNVAWRNEKVATWFGTASGLTNWTATGIPLVRGGVSGTRIIARTNIVTVTATGTSGSELYGGTTTFNTALRVVHVPIRLRAQIAGDQVQLDWSGVAPSFVLQRCTDPGLGDWVNLVTTGETNLVLAHPANREFYRITLP
jgi:predicted esterase